MSLSRSVSRSIGLPPTGIIPQGISLDLASPDDYDTDAYPRTPFQIHDDHEDTTDADLSAFPAGLSSADSSSEHSDLSPLFACEISPANYSASLGTSSDEEDPMALSGSAPLFFPEPPLQTSDPAPDEPPPTPPTSSHLPCTLSPSMDPEYWLDRQWCLDNYGHFDVSTMHYSAPDTVSGQVARRCISARTLCKMASQYPDLTSRPGSVLDYVTCTEVHWPGKADRHEIELVVAWSGRPAIMLTACEGGLEAPEIDVWSWEALGRLGEDGLVVYCGVVRGYGNACWEQGGCYMCKRARRMNGMAMRAFGVRGVDEQEGEKVEGGEGKGKEGAEMGKIRKMVRMFRRRDGEEKRKEKERRAVSEKYRKTQERNVKDVNERRKREERKKEKKAQDLANRTSKESLKKEGK